jgi:hypothetical protein
MSKLIALSGKRGSGKFAIVDDEDYPELSKYKWYLDKDGYAVRTQRVKGSGNKMINMFMHRQILKLEIGDPRQVDHKFHNKLDNRKSEIRTCSVLENTRNQTGHQNTTSVYKGVAYSVKTHKWDVRIQGEYQASFSDEILAAKYYDKLARNRHGEFAYLNFPENTNYDDVNEYLKYQDNYTSKYYGVTRKKECNRWEASLSYKKDGKHRKLYIGLFEKEIDAAKAYDDKLKEYQKYRTIKPKYNFPGNK